MMFRLSKRFVLLNVLLAAVAVFLGVLLVRDYTRKIPLPAPPAARRAQPASPEEPAAPTVTDDKLTTFNVIVAKHLFNPSRSEGGPPPAAPAPPPPPKPTLLGVVVDGPKSRAYLEDAVTKRVLGYRAGDTISGGRLDKITDDKVVIVRPDGAVDVLLRDPSKPKPPAPPTAGAPGQPTPPQAGAPQPGQPTPPAQPPMTPRALRRLPAEQQPQPQPPQQ